MASLKLPKAKYLNLLAITTTFILITGSPIAIAQQPDKKTDSEYINRLLPEAQRIQQEYGVPLDITLAIARLESGNGEYVVGQNNHFGLRCSSDSCVTIEKNGQARSNTKLVPMPASALIYLLRVSKL